MRRMICLVLATVALVAIVAAPPASAATRINCVANGVVDITGDGPYGWSIAGQGPCFDTLKGNFLVNFTGSGTSDTLGLCDGLVVTNLQLTVNLNVLNIRTLQTTNQTQFWTAPLTTFPIVTPFVIHPSTGGTNGLGIIGTRLLLTCPPGGTRVATFLFTTAV